MLDRLREYWSKKSVKQRVYIIIFFTLLLILFIFVIKGSIIDGFFSAPKGEAAGSGKIRFHINPVDLGVLVVVGTIYGIIKFRKNKKRKR